MAYNQKNRDNRKPKYVTKDIEVMLSGTDNFGNLCNTQSLTALLTVLENSKVFDKLSIYVAMRKDSYFSIDEPVAKTPFTNNKPLKGTLNVARIKSYSAETNTLTLVFSEKNSKLADIASNLIVVPHTRADRETKDVLTILGFEMYFKSLNSAD